jgi:hypothetical protein
MVSLLLVACAPAAPSRSRGAILGGARDTGDPAVMLLASYPPDQSTLYTCTASLIAPSLLVHRRPLRRQRAPRRPDLRRL